MKLSLLMLFSVLMITLFPASVTAEEPAQSPEGKQFVADLAESHGAGYWDKEMVTIKDLKLNRGEKLALQGDFYFDVNLGLARMELKDGTVVIFKDGEAWVNELKDPKAGPRLRFHVLTWPWFAVSAYKAKHSFVNPVQGQSFMKAGDAYPQMRQTFAADAGDSPDDWYILFRDPKTGLLAGQSYIVTYGNSKDPSELKASVITYHDYEEVDGVKLSKTWVFYPWTKEQGVAGPEKIKTTIGEYAFGKLDEKLFEVPEGWQKIPMPGK